MNTSVVTVLGNFIAIMILCNVGIKRMDNFHGFTFNCTREQSWNLNSICSILMKAGYKTFLVFDRLKFETLTTSLRPTVSLHVPLNTLCLMWRKTVGFAEIFECVAFFFFFFLITQQELECFDSGTNGLIVYCFPLSNASWSTSLACTNRCHARH